MFNYSYSAIAQFNWFLDNVDKAITVDQSVITQAKAEVKFLRALFYFDIAQCFGDAPLYKTSPKNVEESMIAKSSQADIYAFVHEDLDFAIANLPGVAYATGHAVKGSAMGLKSRVLITQEKWSETAALCQQIMSSNLYSIYGDYEGLFLKRGQKNNPEIMFAVEYLSPSSWYAFYTGINIEYAKHIFLMPRLRDAFECIDGLPITESPLYDGSGIEESMTADETVPWKFRNNRDPRFKYIIRGPNTDWPGSYASSFYDVSGVQNRKAIDTTIQGNSANAYLMDQNFVIMRYADILLMYAEAKNELSGPDQSVYDAINDVRTRPTTMAHPTWAAMPPVDQARYNTKTLVRKLIQQERFVEFPMEGTRYFDLKRWHIAHTLLPTLTTVSLKETE